MDSERRRRLLRALGLGGVAGLAGCQGGGEPDETTADDETTERTGSSFDPAFDVQTRGSTGADTSQLHVTGTVSADRSLRSVEVATLNVSTIVDTDGDEAPVEVTLPVDGGQQYSTTLTATSTDGETVETSVLSQYVPIHVDPVDTDRVVGAHYYPWYETHVGHENWTDRAVSTPVLGEYASENGKIIDQHLAWCLEHGISWLSMSWWGPDSGSDTALTDVILQTDRFEDISFSILYETLDRFEEYDLDLDDPAARTRLQEDFEYLSAQFFGRNNYHRIDGRPVVFFYVADQLSGDVAGAFEEATANIDADPYVLAGVPFGRPPDAYPITDVADGVTAYNPYSSRDDIEAVFHDLYDRGNEVLELGAEAGGLDYTPVVIPGFNDTGLPARIREDNPVLSSTPDRFERVCEQVNPHLEDGTGVLVTSFNEWYENTQVEPSEEYGTRYLELIRDGLATGESAGFDPEGVTFQLQFNQAVPPTEDSNRQLAFMLRELTFREDDTELASYDVGTDTDLLFLEGAYGTESNEERTWRWLGGPDADAAIFVEADVSSTSNAVLVGSPLPDTAIEADVVVDGTKTDHVVFNHDQTEYTVSLD